MGDFFNEFTNNRIFLAAAVAWTTAQVFKVILTYLVDKELKLERMHGSGGMPSAHTQQLYQHLLQLGS